VSAGEICVTGGTGYIGRKVVAALLARGRRVRVLTRERSVGRVTPGASAFIGDALDADSVAAALDSAGTLVHLVGTPHPNPSKAEEFQRVDLASIRASVEAARRTGLGHIVYLSVAQPAPVMQAYIAVRAAGERMIGEARLTATILRPWYVLGPQHWWPIALLPAYAVASLIPSQRETARRLGLVTLGQMVAALVQAVEAPPANGTVRIVDVPAIRTARVLTA
jgi:uncharacterized protein YbjT (DUF2867 family)